MRIVRTAILMTTTVLPVICLGCGGSESADAPDENKDERCLALSIETAEIWTEIVAALRSVQTPEQARQTAPKVRALFERIDAAREEMVKLGEPSDVLSKRIAKEVLPEFEKTQNVYAEQIRRLEAAPELYEAIRDALR